MRTFVLLLLMGLSLAIAQPAQPTQPVVLLSQTGALGPAQADDLLRALDQAARHDAQPVVIRMDTPDWRTRLLAVITDPGVAYVLLMVGFYGLLFEFFSPGLIAPGVIGGISLLLALFALQLLPVNYTGLGLIALGVSLLAAEHFTPGFGLLGLGGIAVFVIGSIMLIDTDAPAYRIPWYLIAAVTAASAGFLLLVLRFALRARQRPVVSGREQLLGAAGQTVVNPDGSVSVRTQGEVWQARASVPLVAGQSVRVVGIDGLVLSVEPVQPVHPNGSVDSDSSVDSVTSATPVHPANSQGEAS